MTSKFWRVAISTTHVFSKNSKLQKTSMVEKASQWFIVINVNVRTLYIKDGEERTVDIEGNFVHLHNA